MMNKAIQYKRAWQGTVIVILLLITLSFNSQKKYSVELSIEQWNGVLQIIDESRAPHTDVKTVTGWIVPQLEKQLKDTTGK